MNYSDPGRAKAKAEVGDIVTLPYEYNGYPPGTKFRVTEIPNPKSRQYATKLEAVDQ